MRLSAYDFVVVTRGQFHTLRDKLSTTVVNFFDLVKTHPNGSKGGLSFPGAGPATKLICGGTLLENRKGDPLLAVLPEILHIRGEDNGGRGWRL